MQDFGTAFNIAHIEEGSYIYGPGCRYVVWVQGCSLHCKGCWNQKMWNFEPNQIIEREKLLKNILAEKYDGVTFLGGEPLQQPENLLWILRVLKGKGIHSMLYTGYELDEIKANPLFLEICKQADILIPGRYHDEERNIYLKWRGSENQKIIYQTGEEQIISESNDVEIVLDSDGSICYLGYPDSMFTNNTVEK